MNYPVVIAGLALLYWFMNTPVALDYSKKTFTLYWWNKCGHCISFMPEWNKLGSSTNGITLRAVEASQNSEMKISAYPTLIYRDGKGNMQTYEGERTALAITYFLSTK
jgi:thiol-disulfide isomerase/thioredoxin